MRRPQYPSRPTHPDAGVRNSESGGLAWERQTGGCPGPWRNIPGRSLSGRDALVQRDQNPPFLSGHAERGELEGGGLALCFHRTGVRGLVLETNDDNNQSKQK